MSRNPPAVPPESTYPYQEKYRREDYGGDHHGNPSIDGADFLSQELHKYLIIAAKYKLWFKACMFFLILVTPCLIHCSVPRTPVSILTLILITLVSCIERYYPGEEDLRSGSLVVSAHLTGIPGVQTVQLSRSVSISNSSFDPVIGGYVEVERSDGEVRVFDETDPGHYQCNLDGLFLQTGSEYHLILVTPDGKRYESGYETLHPVPEIQDVYYEIESMPTIDPEVTDQGIRFYVDFEIEKDSGRFLRWEMEETFEVRNPDYETQMYGKDKQWYDITSELKWLTCWLYRDIHEIFTRDLKNVNGTSYSRLPLNFVSGTTWKLHHRYSLLVRQYSHSEDAYWYWNELAKNVQSGGTLFDAQPALTPSNICNLEECEELVIGYFSISGAVEKRVFVGIVPGLEVYRDPYFCRPGVFPRFLWRYPLDKLPFYVAQANVMGVYENGEVKDECVDCRLYKNSTSEKPEFWEDGYDEMD